MKQARQYRIFLIGLFIAALLIGNLIKLYNKAFDRFCISHRNKERNIR